MGFQSINYILNQFKQNPSVFAFVLIELVKPLAVAVYNYASLGYTTYKAEGMIMRQLTIIRSFGFTMSSENHTIM